LKSDMLVLISCVFGAVFVASFVAGYDKLG